MSWWPFVSRGRYDDKCAELAECQADRRKLLDRLLEQSGVILTPHVAFSSTASVLDLRTRATQDLLRVLAGEQPHHPVRAG